ncbi:MAG: phosphoribosylformylglycinamidine synthase, partial [Firmicutes bacterium]|nr:phosphoribosylformylglycinamidine synthase [Bacillota bacterium]
MVYRIFVEKKPGLDNEARAIKNDITELLQIKGVEKVRLFNRYDVEDLAEDLFNYSVNTVFAEPQLDIVTKELPEADCIFAVEPLPGQFDQRASSAAECIQIISKGERPTVKTAKVYALYGKVSEEEVAAIKKYVINAVESREAAMELPETLAVHYEIPTTVETVAGFIDLTEEELAQFIKDRGLAMDLADIKFCQEYFKGEDRNPTITEVKMIDTYWSDHCRHTTFNTIIDNVTFEDETLQAAYDRYIDIRKGLNRTKPVTLMDIGTIAVKQLKKEGKLTKLDESEEINACTVKIKVDVEGKEEDWLLLFKNETHNHPTEIEPFGGAATCVGGAIRDPLSGRSYVYAAMRVTGAGDPLVPVSETIPGKLPQRKLVATAASGYSSYGNQSGLATGQVDEIYHPGYVAKRMEIGAVIAAAPAENVVREVPADGDRVILLGGKTGRDGCGGATGSSKSHDLSSLESCGAEVQKGNAPEERKLQRLFRNPEASKLIKRCNAFGAGGVSVAIGELAAGLEINLNAVPKKYYGLDGTELAISESQERMAVVIEKENIDAFLSLAAEEN